jgi:hypothetical protein
MNLTYTTSAAIRAHGAEAGSIHEGKKPRYHLRAGLEYLHFSGLKLTSERSQAWVGTVEQGRACRKRFDAAAGCKLRAISAIPAHVEEIQ